MQSVYLRLLLVGLSDEQLRLLVTFRALSCSRHTNSQHVEGVILWCLPVASKKWIAADRTREMITITVFRLQVDTG